MCDFKLLKQLRISTCLAKDPKSGVEQLKSFRELHNQIAEHIWSLGMQIGKATGEIQIELKNERDELKKLLVECTSPQALTGLLRVAADREKVVRKDSEMDVCSPYPL